MEYWLVMPAAGIGQRFGAELPKQYAPLAGRTVIEWSLQPFLADRRCRGIRVAVAEGDSHWNTLRLADDAGRLRAVAGGSQRCDSVRNALAAVPAAATDWVLVHDAARPCLSAGELDRLLAAAATAPDGALLAQPLVDTLKRADGGGAVESTVERAGLWRAQTPQIFRHGLLTEALAHCARQGITVTDEAQAVETLGRRPRLVEGAGTNIKVTVPPDLQLATAILAGQQSC
jgi:2-C-methyl-D-erythritol 4-phosphate cytidylyltransferase